MREVLREEREGVLLILQAGRKPFLMVFWNTCSFSPFAYIFHHLYQHGFMDTCFILCDIITATVYIIAQIVPSLVFWSFLWSAPFLVGVSREVSFPHLLALQGDSSSFSLFLV